MCGIIGIVGKEPVADRLVDGLRRMEYRGYDSAGVCTLDDGALIRRRAEGKLNNLVAELVQQPAPGEIGIAHTRWATHGAPTAQNAHPHATEQVALVHNGIIENYKELRAELRDAGRTLESDTDSEVVRIWFRAWSRKAAHRRCGRMSSLGCAVPSLAMPFVIIPTC